MCCKTVRLIGGMCQQLQHLILCNLDLLLFHLRAFTRVGSQGDAILLNWFSSLMFQGWDPRRGSDQTGEVPGSLDMLVTTPLR